METIKIELSHFPHHVLARAFLAACRLIVILDPENSYVPDPKEVSNMDNRKLISLARDISSHIMEAYLEDKQEIDKKLLIILIELQYKQHSERYLNHEH